MRMPQLETLSPAGRPALAVWDAVSLGANGLVFFWAGAACINFFIRSIGLLSSTALAYAAIPIFLVVMQLMRTGCIALFNVTAFRWLKESEWREWVEGAGVPAVARPFLPTAR